jgi:hypothetical protein
VRMRATQVARGLFCASAGGFGLGLLGLNKTREAVVTPHEGSHAGHPADVPNACLP